MPRVTLVGYRGTGKSTLAAALADALGCSWADADTVLETRLGTTIAALVAGRGEAAFRDAESEVLDDLLASCDGVLSTGGGVVLRPANRLALRQRGRPIVWLDASADVIRDRLARDPTTATRRPGLSGADPLGEVEATLASRRPLYREVADTVIDTSSAPPPAITERIAVWLASGASPDIEIEAAP